MWEAARPLPVWGRLGPPAHRSCAGSRSLASPRESGDGAVLALSPLAGSGSPWMPPPVSLRAPGRAGAARPRPCRRPLSPAAGRCRGEGGRGVSFALNALETFVALGPAVQDRASRQRLVVSSALMSLISFHLLVSQLPPQR